jgi:hypothetical protein
VERTAEKLYGGDYRRADAWDFAAYNHSVWKQSPRDVDYHPYLKEGYVVGIRLPMSHYNEKDRSYTHLALIVGFENGRPLALHYINGEVRYDYLDLFLDAHHAKVKEVISRHSTTNPYKK